MLRLSVASGECSFQTQHFKVIKGSAALDNLSVRNTIMMRQLMLHVLPFGGFTGIADLYNASSLFQSKFLRTVLALNAANTATNAHTNTSLYFLYEFHKMALLSPSNRHSPTLGMYSTLSAMTNPT
nr:unnamed protein product [Callosobruchus chinensis]